MADDKPVIIIKKGHGHHGHHGGAWKVAYADFVTAMMAFFMVMWLLNTVDSATKNKIAHFFRESGAFPLGKGSPILTGGTGILPESFAPPSVEDEKKGAPTSAFHGVQDGKREGGDKEDQLAAERGNATSAGSGEEKGDLSPEGVEAEKMRMMAGGEDDASFNSIEGGGDAGRGEKFGNLSTEGSVREELHIKEGGEQDRAFSRVIGGPKDEGGEATGDFLPTGAESDVIESGLGDGEGESLGDGAVDGFSELATGMAQKVRSTIAASPELSALLGVVDVKVDGDGLNIEIADTGQKSMFASGSARVQPEARAAFRKLAEVINTVPNTVDIVGHTDAKPFGGGRNAYSNWELSTDRANAARRLLEGAGIPAERITSIVGRADRELRFPGEPKNPENRRITMRLRFLPPPQQKPRTGADAVKDLPTAEAKSHQRVHSLSTKEVLDPAANEARKAREAAAKKPVPTPIPVPEKTAPPIIDSPALGTINPLFIP